MMVRGRAWLLQFACAGTLLLAQHGAFTHQVWHVASPGGSQQSAAAAPEHGKSHAPQERLCGLHTALGVVLGALSCAGVSELQPVAADSSFRIAALPAIEPRGVRPASRGPPALF
jgi:hypothetical protein